MLIAGSECLYVCVAFVLFRDVVWAVLVLSDTFLGSYLLSISRLFLLILLFGYVREGSVLVLAPNLSRPSNDSGISLLPGTHASHVQIYVSSVV